MTVRRVLLDLLYAVLVAVAIGGGAAAIHTMILIAIPGG